MSDPIATLTRLIQAGWTVSLAERMEHLSYGVGVIASRRAMGGDVQMASAFGLTVETALEILAVEIGDE